MKRTLALTALLAACDRSSPALSSSHACFRDVTQERGIDFVHENGASGRKYFVETNGSGGAWLDCDGDGDLDLFLVQGAALPGFTPTRPLHSVLLRNDGARFTDVTDAAGVGAIGQGMGACAADYDNDGDCDLYVTNLGTNVLYRNDGGRFTDVTAAAHVGDGERYHSSAAFADFDGDGDLDLYVVGYVDYHIESDVACNHRRAGPGSRSYCSPDMYAAIDDSLFRNDGDGTFTDVTETSGLRGKGGKGLGIALADFDDDGDLDAFIANDSDPNFLLRNDTPRLAEGGRPIHFTDVAAAWGADFNAEGRTQAGMGTLFADLDDDGDLDSFTVNLAREYNALRLNERDHFRDASYASGLAAPSMPFVGFGTVAGDFDNDGDLDLAVANGHVLDDAEVVMPGSTYREPAHLYWNEGGGHFRLATVAEAGDYFGSAQVGRGLLAADFDDDGWLDLLFANNVGAAHLLRNQCGDRGASANRWIGFRLVGRRSNRDAIGAEVRVTAGGRTQRRLVRAGESYLGSHDRRVLIGLGPLAPTSVDAEILWPDGSRQKFSGLEAGRYHPIDQAE